MKKGQKVRYLGGSGAECGYLTVSKIYTVDCGESDVCFLGEVISDNERFQVFDDVNDPILTSIKGSGHGNWELIDNVQ